MTSSSITRLLVALILVAGCSSGDKYVPGTGRKVLGVPMNDVKSAITARLDSGKTPSWVKKDRWKRVQGLYKVYGNAPLWLEPEGVRDRASALLKTLEEAPQHALSTDGYPIDSIRVVVNADELAKKATPQALADADVLLTAAYVAYASDMLMGQVDPKSVSQAWHIGTRVVEVDSALVRTLQSLSMARGLAEMVPQDSGYALLKKEYVRYQEIVSAGGWSPIAGSGAAAKAAVAARLRAEGYEVDSANQAVAIKEFQEHHGLDTTGRVDGVTLRSMNVSASERMAQIASNLERHRWLPHSLGTRYILVNVPAFRLEAFDAGQKTLEMKVVVGAEYEGRSTPVFSDSMEFVVFRPYWNVTPSIAAKEFFPKYGTTNLPEGYETWNEKGNLRIRQRPGEKNSLGLVKFMFPNDFNIYLHDTPAKSLFKLADRAASHGCIRLEKPDQLAEFVLGWPNDRVHAAMNGTDNKTVMIPQKIPVYIVYFTAFAHDGHLNFGDDLYDRDERLEDKMDSVGAPAPKPAGPKA